MTDVERNMKVRPLAIVVFTLAWFVSCATALAVFERTGGVGRALLASTVMFAFGAAMSFEMQRGTDSSFSRHPRISFVAFWASLLTVSVVQRIALLGYSEGSIFHWSQAMFVLAAVVCLFIDWRKQA